MKKLLLSSLLTGFFALSSFIRNPNESYLTNSNNYNRDLPSALIFNLNNSNTKKFWDNTINTSTYKNDYSSSFIQNDKYDFDYNDGGKGKTFQQSKGYTIQHSGINGASSPSGLDLFSYVDQKTDPIKANIPEVNSEFNGYRFGARTDILGMSFGLTGSLSYYLQTSSPNNNLSFDWNYTNNFSLGLNDFIDINDNNSSGTAPIYAHGNTDDQENYPTAYKNDYAYYQLWYTGINNSLSNNELLPPDNKYDTGSGILKLYNHSWSSAPKPTTNYYLESPWNVSYRGPNGYKHYTIYSLIIPNENTDVILTEYIDHDDDSKIHLIEDVLNNTSVLFNQSPIYQNNGYRFANVMLPYWYNAHTEFSNQNNFNKWWYYYLNYGLFPSSNKSESEDLKISDYNLYESPFYRVSLSTDNISDKINNFLSYNKDDYTKWDKYNLQNTVNVQTYSAKNNITQNTSNKLDPTSSNPIKYSNDDIWNNLTNPYKYHFMTMRSQSKYSGINKKNPELVDSYDSYSPYSFYTGLISENNTPINNNYYYLNFLNSKASSGTGGKFSDSSSYLYGTNSIRKINDNDKDIFGKKAIQFFPKDNPKNKFPDWGISIIIIFAIFLICLFGFLYWRNYKINKWKKDQENIKSYNAKNFIVNKKYSNDKK